MQLNNEIMMQKSLQSLLLEQKNSLTYFFEKLFINTTIQQMQKFLQCRGTIFFTGIGKSAFVAEKIARTISSTGTKTGFFSPVDALHGDMGVTTPNDIVVFISKSGESEELLSLIPHLTNKGVFTIAWTSTEKSRLMEACDHAILIPLKKELCPFNLAPTTSSTLQMLYGDLVTVALMKAKKFPLDTYAKNHPGGKIGKRANIKVCDLMLSLKSMSLCHPEETIETILPRHLEKRQGATLIISQKGSLLGIFTDGDLGRAIHREKSSFLGTTISKVMTENPITVSPQTLAWDALQIMESHHHREITVIPVVEKSHQLLGLIKLHDILQSGV